MFICINEFFNRHLCYNVFEFIDEEDLFGWREFREVCAACLRMLVGDNAAADEMGLEMSVRLPHETERPKNERQIGDVLGIHVEDLDENDVLCVVEFVESLHCGEHTISVRKTNAWTLVDANVQQRPAPTFT